MIVNLLYSRRCCGLGRGDVSFVSSSIIVIIENVRHSFNVIGIENYVKVNKTNKIMMPADVFSLRSRYLFEGCTPFVRPAG